MKLVLIALLAIILVSSTVLSHAFVEGKSKDSKAKDKIIKAIGKAVEGKYSTIKLIQLSKSNVTGYILAYNNTKAVTPPSPPPNPPPVPTPTGNVSKVCLIGDLKGSTVPNMMKDCNYKIGLGDLGYGSDLSYFKGLKFDRCVAGNHDTKEDGSNSLESETIAYCGDHWSLKIGESALIFGFNTNGDAKSTISAFQGVLANSSLMKNVKTVVFVSHKAGHVPPNSHHPAEAAALYKQLEALVPQGVTLYTIAGHNHVSSSAPSMNWYQAGSGGKSFYSCGQDQIWTYCDNTHLQFLELTIDNNNGNTAAKFIK